MTVAKLSAPLAAAGPEVSGRLRRLASVGGSVLLAQFAVALLAFTVAGALRFENMADFHVLREAGGEIVHGTAGGFAYPPPAAFAMIPFSLLPYGVAAPLWLALLVVSIPLTLLVLGVRDWRCHAAAFLAASTLAVLGSGSMSSLLALGAALLWRYRDRVAAAALLVGVVAVAKIFLWPLLVWLVATRRYRAAALGMAAAGGAALAGWALTGFAGFAHYPARIGGVATLEQGKGYSPVALALSLGLPVRAAQAAAVVAGLAVLALVFRVARGDEGDRRALTLTIAAALVLSPISWLHYFVLLLVPIALASPTFSVLWLAPLAYWAIPMRSEGDLPKIALATLVTAAIVAWVVRARAVRGAEA